MRSTNFPRESHRTPYGQKAWNVLNLVNGKISTLIIAVIICDNAHTSSGQDGESVYTALLCLGNLNTSAHLVERLAHAPGPTKLTPQPWDP